MTTAARAWWARTRLMFRPVARVLAEAAPIDLRALACFRVCLGLLVATDAVARWPDLHALYSDEGVLPRSVLSPLPQLRLYLISGSPTWAGVLLGVTMVAGVLLAVGWHSRAMALACWWLMASLHARNWQVLQAGDALLVMLLMWSALLPLGARASLDARRRRRMDAPAAAPDARPVREPSSVYGAATVALYVQLALVYFVTGTAKLSQRYWRVGEGVYNALSADTFATQLGTWIYPHWWALVLLNYATLILEVGGPFLLLVPARRATFRTVLALSFVAFHLGLAATMRLGMFSYVCCAAWTVALPTAFWDRLSRGRRWADDGTVPAPAGAAGCGTIAAVLCTYMVVAAMVADRLGDTRVGKLVLVPADQLAWKLRWNMFVTPRTDTGWFVFAATLVDGRVVDLQRGGAPLSWQRPALPSAVFRNWRWRKYLTNLKKDDHQADLERLGDHLCREGRDGRWGSPLRSVQVVYVKHTVGTRYARGPDERDAYVTRTCP